MSTLTIAVVGSRSFNDYSKVKSILDKFLKHGIKLVSGGAAGADTLAERYAKENDLEITVLKPEWNKYGKRAGFMRNEDIIDACDIVVAFWDGKSPGTKNSVDVAYSKQKKVFLIIESGGAA